MSYHIRNLQANFTFTLSSHACDNKSLLLLCASSAIVVLYRIFDLRQYLSPPGEIVVDCTGDKPIHVRLDLSKSALDNGSVAKNSM